jgi:PKD repeat protein
VDIDSSGPYHYGDIVNLTAVPSEGSIFDHWSGNLSGNTNPEKIIMNENKIVTAHFVKTSTNGGNGGSNGGGGNKGSTGFKPKPKLNKPPVADLSAGELYVGFINEEIDFDASLSYDYDGYIMEWLWDFGDGTTSLGEITSHAYSNPGEYTVILKVTDNKGASDSDETTAVVIQPNHPPSEPIVNGPTEGFVNIDYLFSIVSTDEDNDKIKYIIDWGNGNIIESEFMSAGQLFNVSHKWIESGNYTIKVTVDDSKTNATNELEIKIEEPDISDTPEENNFILIIFALLGLMLLLLFLLLSKNEKKRDEE